MAGRIGNLATRLKKKREQPEERWAGDHISEDELQDLIKLQRLTKERPEVFLLNNLILAVHFFTNHEKELKKAMEAVIARENEFNQELLPEKATLLTDALAEHFNGRIRFSTYCKSDTEELSLEPLRPLKIYVIYENVIVSEIQEARYYSNPGELNLNYTFLLKETNYQGYVRLENVSQPSAKDDACLNSTKLISTIKNLKDICSEDESAYEPTDIETRNLFHELLDEDVFERQSSVEASVSSESRGYKSGRTTAISSASSSSSEYATNYVLDSDIDCVSPESERQIKDCKIPSRCFKRITYMYNGRVYNPRKEQRGLTNQQRRIRDAKLLHNYEVVYLSGHRFAKYFFENFRARLARRLGFDEKSVRSAVRCEASTRLERIDYLSDQRSTSIEQFEVLPCFSSPWPKGARKWLQRTRADWPSLEDVQRVERSPCYLVPEGPRPLTSAAEVVQPLAKLYWSPSFPSAERFLETCLSGPQVHVYTLALLLHKTFVRSVNPAFSLDTSHLRHLLFWMVEKQPHWQEREMGQYMITFLESLHNHIQHRTMSDYFIQDRNLFGNVATEDLLHSQKQLKRIIENPVMFLFHAMERICYEQDDYPRLDYRKLLRLLTINEILLINPNLNLRIQRESDEITATVYARREVSRKFWSEAKQMNQYYTQMRKLHTNTAINPMQALDSIIDIQEQCEPLTNARLSLLLIFFSEHFLKMTDFCRKIGDTQQWNVYLTQTRLLALLLSDDPNYEQEAKRILQDVGKQRQLPVQKSTSLQTQSAPETPKRNTDQPSYTSSLMNHFYQHQQTLLKRDESKSVRIEVNVQAAIDHSPNSSKKPIT